MGHTVSGSHRGRNAALNAISDTFYWKTQSTGVDSLLTACINFISTTGGHKEPLPYVFFLHGRKPNYLIQFDYLDMSISSSGDLYPLLIKDDHLGHRWFYPTPNTCAEDASHALID